jgi:transcriptional regulator with XRE-family HTH domain
MTEADKEKKALIKEIGQRFSIFRKYIKKSQEELANELRISPAAIAGIEMGKSSPLIPVQNYLYWEYHLSINWLITGIGEMIIVPVKDSKIADSPQLDASAPSFEKYAELNSLMKIPVIEKIIFAKLSELKVIAAEEIKSFFEVT